ncbi:MAG: hypothetical protein QOJ65_2225, partial [Fimbriimonadaceae bacterium]|nr:hypothetical protein [Fimbriimonadaceae bacterium]
MAAIAEVKQGTITWNIDPTHSHVQFSVRHLGILTVRGSFDKVTGTAETVDGKLSRAEATIDASSISTRVADRDAHLRSADFFNTEKWPDLRFVSTQVTEKGRNHYTVLGDLTMAGQTHPIELDVETTDPIKDPWGNLRAGATGHAEISRKKWGLVWNQILETGGLAVSDEVKITI